MRAHPDSVERHPRFAELRERFLGHPEWFKPWTGTIYRFQTLDFPSPIEVLSGRGAALRGGRWNPQHLGAVYGSTTDRTALEECNANDRYYGVRTRSPRILVVIEATLSRRVDLTDRTLRRVLGITLKELAREDWRRLQDAGRESLTQAIGRAVFATGGSGLVVPSASCPRGMNVVIFPSSHRNDRMEVVEGHKLGRLTSVVKR